MNNSHSILASTYGSSNYSNGTFGCASNCETTVSTPLAPLTGFFAEQPSFVIVPALLALAVLLGGITYTISRKLKKKHD